MKLIFLALFVSSGLMFGIMALVIDLGFDFGQQGALQNGADAGAMATAKLLAGSVVSDSPEATYGVTDSQLRSTASDLAGANRPAATVSVEYLYWNGSCGPATHPVSNNQVPDGTCAVRVTASAVQDQFFARLIGHPTANISAQAVAAIIPTTPPTDISNVWPVTEWISPGVSMDSVTNCTPANPCPFWNSKASAGTGKGQNQGSYKGMIDLSKISSLSFPSPTEQLFYPDLTNHLDSCPATFSACWDNTTPAPGPIGAKASGSDTWLDVWLKYGWQGHVYVNEADWNNGGPCSDKAKVLSQCRNARLTLDNGTDASISDDFTYYITHHPDDPGGSTATVAVLFWSYAEANVNTSTSGGSGQLWDSSHNLSTVVGKGRIVTRAARLFRFSLSDFKQQGNSNSISGYYVSFYNPSGNPVPNKPPSNTANTVALIG
jgi:hypothetical protein